MVKMTSLNGIKTTARVGEERFISVYSSSLVLLLTTFRDELYVILEF
jgi:hypothetical protein